MTRRPLIILVPLLLAAVLLTGCGQKVRVETGQRVTCTYGEVLTDTVEAIDVPADKAGGYRVVEKTVTCDRHKKLENLYAAAQASIAAGDLASARSKLDEVVKSDPLFKKAQQQLDQIQAGKKPLVDGASGSTPATGTASEGKKPIGPIANLAGLVPDSLPGYKAEPVIAEVFNLTREYLPTGSTGTDGLVVVVEQYKDAKAAKLGISGSIARSYPSSRASMKIEGRTVYFGTDGNRFAVAAWNENGVLVAVEASSKTGKPSSLKAHLASLVGAIVR